MAMKKQMRQPDKRQLSLIEEIANNKSEIYCNTVMLYIVYQ